MTVFYDLFERHAHGEGLKGHSTHYCPGCGHGLIQKYLAEAIDELGIQDRTIAVSPVGCAVFMYYYLDVGNTQAAHGRAPAVAVAHKLANPEAIVISYQGDGDLASIGLAEILSAAELSLPISVIFVNNAIYGMTGGQMAPTSLPGQVTATSPGGRGIFEGKPLRMSEMIAGLDGPIYVERVALYDPKQRTRARKAIKKALELQIENRGFSFVEVLAECPTHLQKTPGGCRGLGARRHDAVLPARRQEGPHRRAARRAAGAGLRPAAPAGGDRRLHHLAAALREGLPRCSSARATSASSSPAPAATARRRRRCCSPTRRSTKASTPRRSPPTDRSRAAAPRTPTCGSPPTMCSRRRCRGRTCWWRSTPRASPSSRRRSFPAAC